MPIFERFPGSSALSEKFSTQTHSLWLCAKNIDPGVISIFGPGDKSFRRILENNSSASRAVHSKVNDIARAQLLQQFSAFDFLFIETFLP